MYLKLILMGLVVSLLTNCGSNHNDLAIPGQNCGSKLDVGALDLEDKDRSSQKVGEKVSYENLPDGAYKLVTAQVFVAEIIDGNMQDRKAFKAYGEVIIVPAGERKELEKNLKPGEKVDEQKLYKAKMNCISNLPSERLDYKVEGISSFEKVSGTFETIETKSFDLSYDIGPKDKFEIKFSKSDSEPDIPDDFYKGDNRDSRKLEFTIYPTTEKSKEKKDLYQIRQQFTEDNILVRLVISVEFTPAVVVPDPKGPEEPAAVDPAEDFSALDS